MHGTRAVQKMIDFLYTSRQVSSCSDLFALLGTTTSFFALLVRHFYTLRSLRYVRLISNTMPRSTRLCRTWSACRQPPGILIVKFARELGKIVRERLGSNVQTMHSVGRDVPKDQPKSYVSAAVSNVSWGSLAHGFFQDFRRGSIGRRLTSRRIAVPSVPMRPRKARFPAHLTATSGSSPKQPSQ